VLICYNMAPTQLMLGAWRMILGFEALCVDFANALYSPEDFATCYSMRRLPSRVCTLSSQGSQPRLIVNLSDSDHEWNSIVVRVSSSWETVIESDRGNILISWSTGVLPMIANWFRLNLRSGPRNYIEYNKHNWGWLLA